MKEHSRKNQRDYVLQVLVNKYRVDPDRFRSYLPEIAQQIEMVVSSPIKRSHVSTLTELERERLCKALLQIPKDKKASKHEAIQALEYCATLIQDESLPDEIGRRVMLGLIQNAVDTPVSKIKKTTKITVDRGEATKTLAISRGIYLHLTWNDKLVAISIFPWKSKERSEAMKFVGIAGEKDRNLWQKDSTKDTGCNSQSV